MVLISFNVMQEMLNLIPNWIETNEDFWNSLKRRNLFLIKLRFVAAIMLFAFNYLYEHLINIELSEFQHDVIGVLTLFLFGYNILFYSLQRKIKEQEKGFNPLHFSLIQIVIDLFVLTLLIIVTGGIESPFYLFYIFHLIIGSLILPGIIIYSIALGIVLVIFLISALELEGILPHYCVTGMYNAELYNNIGYVFTSLLFFSMMVGISVFLTHRIATQLYSQEKKLYDALKEIKDAELKKQKYILGVVHEIKSPIAVSKSIISLIVDGFVGDVSEKVKEKLERAVLRLNEGLELINNILKISRLRLLNNKTVEDVDVTDIIEKILDSNKERFEEKNIKIKVLTEGKKRVIKGDGELLKLVFSNIIGNGIKYTGENGDIEIRINFKSDFLFITICDSGSGIPEGEEKKIFENYYRIKSENANTHEGAGVGLTLVKEIVLQHRGKIRAYSPSHLGKKDNRGTCFEIILPFELAEIDETNKEKFLINGL